MDTSVVDLNHSGSMTPEEANRRVGVINRFTKPLATQIDQLINQMEALGPQQTEKTNLLEKEVEALIEIWNAKIRKLGGKPKGMWLVDFDAGDGYFCWKYPEAEILHWHEYKSGFPGRISLKERERRKQIKVVDPIEELIDRL